MEFWTAGQRIDPSTESTFVWRLTSTDTYSDAISVMRYTNWYPGQPDYWRGNEACMDVPSHLSYRWNDLVCREKICSVCELETS